MLMPFFHPSFLLTLRLTLRPQLPYVRRRGPVDTAGIGAEKIFPIISLFIEYSTIAFNVKSPVRSV